MKGIAEGRLERIEKKCLSNARKMKEIGLDYTMIADVTGLTSEDIANL